MLVLSRKTNEVLHIGHDVKIQVVSVRGDKVRLGIDAPASVMVHRSEVYSRATDIDRSVCPCCGQKRQEGVSDAV